MRLGRREGGGGPRPRRSVLLTITGWLSVIVAAALVGAALTAYAKYRDVWESIHRVSVTHLGKRPPKFSTTAENILVFGSDSRAGLTPHEQFVLHVGHDGCGCSDTLMVVHISPGHHRVIVINIPRDTMVPVYSCAAGPGYAGQQAYPGALVQINATLEHGGPSCLWRTVEQVTGIHLDHFIQLKFTGVVNVINDLGGVNVCVPFPISDPNSGLNIGKGVQHINGLTFLEYWRARYSIADGTDLKRIQRDDLLLAEVLRAVLHGGLLANPGRLVQLVTDVASSLTTDTGLTQQALLSLAESMRGISTSHAQFIELQTAPYAPAPAQVVLVQPQDDHLFAAIAHDTNLPRAPRPGRQSGTPAITASKVTVEVLNGSGVSGIAAQAAADLQHRGFVIAGTADATTASGGPDFSYTAPVIEYASPADLPAAHLLAQQVPGAAVQMNASLTPGKVTLIIGSRYAGLAPATSPSASPGVSGLAKQYGGLTGNATCRSASAAFTGPLSPASQPPG